MADAPKITADRLDKISKAWKKLAPSASFGGMTLAQFTSAVKPSLDARATLSDLEAEVTDAINTRDTADVISNDKADLVVRGVNGDPNFGPDSSLYEEMGYIRTSERKSGLTRKKKAPPAS